MIRFSCPKCNKVYKAANEQAGKKSLCKQCNAFVLIPQPITEVHYGVPLPLEDISKTAEPEPIPPVGTHPAANPFAELDRPSDKRPREDDEVDEQQPRRRSRYEEDEDEPIRSNRRRLDHKLTLPWRVATAITLAMVLLGFFLPWVKVKLTPPSVFAREFGFWGGELELARQSGLQMSIGSATPGKLFKGRAEREWRELEQLARRDGTLRAKLNEAQRRISAAWLLLVPLLSVVALSFCGMTPSPMSCGLQITMTGIGLLVLTVQFGIIGTPIESAIYENLPIDADSLFLFLEFEYMGGLALTILGLVGCIAVQILVLCLKQFLYPTLRT